jgi:RNA polymerase sigma factor (sigma-70 family)
MARQALSTVVEHARVAAYRNVPDAELLEQFLCTRDEAAFAALVRRYRSTVLAACRQVLADDADVEDAAQQTFLALWRNVRAIRNRHSIGGWLFGVAHRIAVKGLNLGRRRRAVEGRASASRTEVADAPDISWREACAILHEELDRLADKHRLPLLLCYLDGKSRDEAAKQLGWSVGAVKGHLQRGRIRLRDRLARRGVTLSAGLLAAAVGARANAGPSLSVTSIVKAVVCESPRRVVGLAAGVRAVSGLAVLMTVVAVGVGARVATSEPDERPKATSSHIPQPRVPADGEMVTLSGRVLRPDGGPAVGAKLVSYHENAEPGNLEHLYLPIVRGATDGEGRFRIDVPKTDLGYAFLGDLLPIVATADGFGIDWATVKDPRQELTLRLVPDQPLAGRVIDSEGRPVANATVEVMTLQTSVDEKLDPYLAVVLKEGRDARSALRKGVYRPGEMALSPARTDAAGRFKISGVGRERLVVLDIASPGIARDVIYVVARAGFDPSPYRNIVIPRKPDMPRPPDPGPPLHGPAFDFVATPGKVVEGTVVNTEGKPIAGARVSTTGRAIVAQKTDATGKFRLNGVRKQPTYDLSVQGDQQSAYLPQTFRVTDSEGLQPVRAEIRMTRGVVLTGRVVDSVTGAGAQAALSFVPLPGNAYFGKAGYETYQWPRNSYPVTTGPDGSYRLPILPGLGVLKCQGRGTVGPDGRLVSPYLLANFSEEDRRRVQPAVKGFVPYFSAADGQIETLINANLVKVLDLPSDAAPTNLNLELPRGMTATLTIQDPEGQALIGAVVGGTMAAPATLLPLGTAQCTVYGLEPEGRTVYRLESEGREVIVYHAGRGLAKRLTIKGDTTDPATIRLEPTGTVTGRVFDAEGKPVPHAEISVVLATTVATVEITNYVRRHHPPVRTDTDGRFRLTGITPDVKFGFNIRSGETFLVGKPPLGMKEVKPGATLDVGEFRTEPRSQ